MLVTDWVGLPIAVGWKVGLSVILKDSSNPRGVISDWSVEKLRSVNGESSGVNVSVNGVEGVNVSVNGESSGVDKSVTGECSVDSVSLIASNRSGVRVPR